MVHQPGLDDATVFWLAGWLELRQGPGHVQEHHLAVSGWPIPGELLQRVVESIQPSIYAAELVPVVPVNVVVAPILRVDFWR